LTQILLGGAGLILIVLLISGCTPVSPAVLEEAPDSVQNAASVASTGFPLPYSLEDLTRFYARFREEAEAETGSEVQSQASHPWSVTDRVRFQDRVQADRATLDGLDMKDLGNLQRWGLDERY
jgi:hypothetical protein